MARFFVSVAFFAALSVGVGFLLAGNDSFDWGMAVGLFALALAGEGFRLWIRHSRARARQSSEI